MTEKLTLTELQLIIRDSLYTSLPDFYWVVAEISELKENSAGHCYLELVEKDPGEKNISSKVKAIIWSSRYRFLKSLFKNVAGEDLREGFKILAKIKVEYHELYGLSLIISDIDPSFTIGEMAIRRQQIIQQLEEDGVFLMNKELDFPFVPQRIAIISSKSAAGYTDFIRHLKENSFGYIFYTSLFETVMQGIETEKSLTASLDRVAEYQDLFDVAVIIRGGGSQIDLSWFDNYKIAYHVTQFPMPVLTGIGHEKDLSVTDMVAFQSLKTPTAVADHLIDCIVSAEDHLNEIVSEIDDYAKSVIDENKKFIETYRMQLVPATRLMISYQKEKLTGSIIEMISLGKELLQKAGIIPANLRSQLLSVTNLYSAEKNAELKRGKKELLRIVPGTIERNLNRVKGFENSLNILNPDNVLRRGYTITTSNGRLIKATGEVEQDDIIDTQFVDGKVRSRVINKGR
jgi:exodeoxyribonuclease VII large subunit